jgi:dipeptidyl aminopeptidase/acylaminoacyl peptidase
MSDELSPLRLADADAPPVLTIHGDRDTVVPHAQATAFHDRLEELGVRNELITLSGGNHGGFSDQQDQHAFRSIFAFLEGVVR